MVQNERVHFYVTALDNKNGTFLLVGIDNKIRKHKAIGCRSWHHPVLMVERREQEVREFLLGLRPLMRGLENRVNVNKFLRCFTSANPVKWNEAKKIIFEDLSLQEAVYGLIRQLPLFYLKQYAPLQLFTTINLAHIIPRTV